MDHPPIALAQGTQSPYSMASSEPPSDSDVQGVNSPGPHPNGRTGRIYVHQACQPCRRRKRKCDGRKPICGSCATSGDSKCIYARKRNKLPLLVEELEGRVAERDATITELNARITSLEITQRERISGAQDRHLGASFASLSSTFGTTSDFSDVSTDGGVQELFAPRKQLRGFEPDDELQQYGPTSVLKFSTNTAKPLTQPTNTTEYYASYVLFADGESNSRFEWDRHLPSEITITRLEHDKILYLVFKFVTSWCSEVIPALFLRDMHKNISVPSSRTPPKTVHYSAMLHNALLALGVTFSDEPGLRDPRPMKAFVTKANSYLETERQTPSISLLQALSVLGSFYWSQGDYNLASMYLGMSVRVRQDLGLHLDCTPQVNSCIITTQNQLDRNWASWTSFCRDVCWSLFIGRECTAINGSGLHTIPMVIPNSTSAGGLPYSLPQATAPQFERPTMIFKEICSLLVIGRRIVDVLNGSSVNGDQHPIDPEVNKIDAALAAWKQDLPQELNQGSLTASIPDKILPQCLMLHLSFYWLSIIIHRDFCNGPNGDAKNHQDLCYESAQQINSLVEIWRSKITLRCVPVTLAQIVFSAGAVFVAQIPWEFATTDHTEIAIHQTEQCIQYLSEVGGSFPFTHRIADVLRGLTQEQQEYVQAMKLPSHPAEQRMDTLHLDLRSHEQAAIDAEPPSWEAKFLGNLRTDHDHFASAHHDSELDYSSTPGPQTTAFDPSPAGGVMIYFQPRPDEYFGTFKPRHITKPPQPAPLIVRQTGNPNDEDITKPKAATSTSPTKDGGDGGRDQPQISEAPRLNHRDEDEFVLVTSQARKSSGPTPSNTVDGLADAIGKFTLSAGARSNNEDNGFSRVLASEFRQQAVPSPARVERSTERKPRPKGLDATPLELLNNTYRSLAFPSTDERSELTTKHDMKPRRVQRYGSDPSSKFPVKLEGEEARQTAYSFSSPVSPRSLPGTLVPTPSDNCPKLSATKRRSVPSVIYASDFSGDAA